MLYCTLDHVHAIAGCRARTLPVKYYYRSVERTSARAGGRGAAAPLPCPPVRVASRRRCTAPTGNPERLASEPASGTFAVQSQLAEQPASIREGA
jgi:hypothetical protein